MDSPKGRWWLFAYLLPVLTIGVGLLFAFTARFNQDDWFGMRYIVPVALGVFFGSILSCVATIVSLVRRENRSAFALLPGMASFIFLVYTASIVIPAYLDIRNRKNQDQHEQKIMTPILAEFKAHPELITSDDYWNSHTDFVSERHSALCSLIDNNSIKISDDTKNYLLNRFVFTANPDAGIFISLGKRHVLSEADLNKALTIKNPIDDNWISRCASDFLRMKMFKTKPNETPNNQ